MKRLSEELEQQGEAVNHHADLLHQKDLELQRAHERASRAQEELISMEPPTLAQAENGIEVLLRVSTADVNAEAAPAGGREEKEESEDVGGEGASGRGGDDHGSLETQKPGPTRVWCLVKYQRKSKLRPRPGAAQCGSGPKDGDGSVSSDGGEGEAETATTDGVVDATGDNAMAQEGEQQERVGVHDDGEVSVSNLHHGGAAAGSEMHDTEAAHKRNSSSGSQATTAEGDDHEVVASGATSEGGASGDVIGERNVPEGRGEDDQLAHHPADDSVAPVTAVEAPSTAADTAAERDPADTAIRPEQHLETLIEWFPQEQVDEWFALQLARAAEADMPPSGEDTSHGGEAAGALADLAIVAPSTNTQAPPELPVLDMPLTVQEQFAADLKKLREELEGRLEEARAELSQNTEAYKQYRARVSEKGIGDCGSRLIGRVVWGVV